MTKRLVIAEKPSVGMTIAAILGASARKDVIPFPFFIIS